MTNKEILIDSYGIGHAVAVRENGKLKDLFIDPKNCDFFYPPSTVFKSKILRRIKQRGAYFIKLPNNKEGFLVTKKNYQEGQVVPVMAKVFSEYEKLQRFTDKIKVETKYFIFEEGNGGIYFSKSLTNIELRDQLVCILKNKLGAKENSKSIISIIIRSSVNNSIEESWDKIVDYSISCFDMTHNRLNSGEFKSVELLSKQKVMNFYGHEGSYKIVERSGVFETHGIWDEVDKLCLKKVIFGNSSHLIIEQTSAFCAIDVNTGGDLSIEPKALNLNACRIIVENILLRAIGGKIIIDFLPCSRESQQEILRKMVSIFALEGRRANVMGWTKGNNFEIERERDKIPLNFLMNY